MRTASTSRSATLHDEVSHSLFSRRAGKNSKRRSGRSPIQDPEAEAPKSPQGSRRPRFSFFLFSCQRTRCRSDIARPGHPGRLGTSLRSRRMSRPSTPFRAPWQAPFSRNPPEPEGEGFRRQRQRRRRWSGLYGSPSKPSTPFSKKLRIFRRRTPIRRKTPQFPALRRACGQVAGPLSPPLAPAGAPLRRLRSAASRPPGGPAATTSTAATIARDAGVTVDRREPARHAARPTVSCRGEAASPSIPSADGRSPALGAIARDREGGFERRRARRDVGPARRSECRGGEGRGRRPRSTREAGQTLASGRPGQARAAVDVGGTGGHLHADRFAACVASPGRMRRSSGPTSNRHDRRRRRGSGLARPASCGRAMV